MNDKRKLSEIFLIASILIWGFSFISIKVCSEVIPIAFLSFIRFLIAALVLIGMCIAGKNKEKIQRKHIASMSISGIFGITLYYYFEGLGIKNISASSVSILNATVPLFTLIAEIVLYKRKIKISYIIALLISITGIGFIVDINLKSFVQPGCLAGYFFILLSVLCWVIYTLITRTLFDDYSEITITTYQTLFGTIAFIPFMLKEQVQFQAFNSEIICNIAFLGVFSSALAYYFYAAAIKNIGIVKSSMGLNLVPVITIGASAFILKEAISMNMALGCIMIFMSLRIISSKHSQL
ncbi:DMT family transporter [Clostridium sp. 19966]|uniref:DMT family transporter n=1 Tax=Clostridium sp. 19966 TaxID=2768166 RepID=UPI0028DD423C|nr:DMT family transporter [Clostridium sp. 19966]MDT8719068.1 DMT family transporter [Clostridium sp. 19966]